jgi:hypothetical protein
MEGLDYWRLCDRISVIQAALLILGVDPADQQYSVEHRISENQPEGYQAVRTALINSITRGDLPADAAYEDGVLEAPEAYNWHGTLMAVDDLRTWLRKRGITTGFFFPTENDRPDYLDPTHAKYAPKLAAAIEAWTAIAQDDEATSGKSVKQALMAWLRRHADRYGLTKDDGNPNEQGIEEAAKVANWDSSGGAPRTPSANLPTPSEVRK